MVGYWSVLRLRKNMMQADRIRNRLLTAHLPVMPQILFKLIELCQQDDAGMGELAKLIANDAGMTAKILTVANNAAYNRSGNKVGLAQALNTLGTETIKTLVISESVLQTFSRFTQAPGTDLRTFWVHALKSAVLSREIAKKMRYANSEEAYLAGLLHDVGRLALLSVAPGEYAENFMALDDEHLCTIETRSLGMTHAEAGAWLVEQWKFDSFIADSVLYHHEPIVRLHAAHPLIRAVRLAHLSSCSQVEEETLHAAGMMCEIDAETLLDMIQVAAGQAKTAAGYLGIELDDRDQELPRATYTPAQPMENRTADGLVDEVRNIALVAAAGQSFARMRSDKELLESITRTARILFGFSNITMLLHRADSRALMGIPLDERQQRLGEFSVSLDSGGVIAETALKRQVTFSNRNADTLVLVEEQLLRFMGAESIVCLPLTAKRQCFGVLVGSVTLEQAAELRSRARLLQSFASQASASLEAAATARSDVDKRIASINEEHQAVSRRVAHEVNNPLSIIKNYLAVLDDKLARNEPVKEELVILNEEIDRVGRIVDSLAGQTAVLEPEPVEINGIVNEVVKLFRTSRFLPASVSILVDTSKSAAHMNGSADTLKQILLNLIKNSVEALPQGGRIEIRNQGRVMRDGRAYFELLVSDTGPGIPEEVLLRLFSPVQSSKSGSNRGLGLNIVHNLVKRINGMINCRSGESGTIFEIFIPTFDSVEPAGGESQRIAHRI